MRRFIGYLALLGIGLCVPDGPSSNSLPLRNPLFNYSPYYNPGSATAPILSYSNTHGVDGSYSYRYGLSFVIYIFFKEIVAFKINQSLL